MVKYIVIALVLLVTGCSGNNNITQKQVDTKPSKMLTQAHTNTRPSGITQASSTATTQTGSPSLTIKEVPNGKYSDLLKLIQQPSKNPVNQTPTTQAPTNNTKEQIPTDSVQQGQKDNTDTAQQGQESHSDSTQFAQQVLVIVNQERSKAGLGSLTMDDKLSSMAMAKAQDMYNNNYFDHQSPTHGSPFDMMQEFGITYNSAGENIANGQTTPTQVMNEWMNSPGHKANILNSSYTHIGIAYYNNEWVQEFTG